VKVLIVNSADKWGGGETHVYDLVLGLQEKGIEVIVACRQESALHARLMDNQIPCFVLPLLNSIDFYSVYKIVKFISEEKINVIHAHLSRDYWLCTMAGLFNSKVKVILTRHVLFPLKRSFFHKFLLRRVSKIICVSQATKQVLANHPDIVVERLEVIPNAIKEVKVSNVDNLKESLNIKKENIAIGVFGSIEEIKGQQDFIEMARLVHAQHPETKFYIVGHEKQVEYAKKIKGLAKEYGLLDHILFTGHREDAISVMRTMDIVVSVAKQDAFGLVILEAMSQGRPVVAYATHGAMEIVQNDVCGILIQVNNYQYLAEKVLELLTNDKLRREFGESGEHFVKEHFNLQVMVEKTIEAYCRCF